MLNYFTDTIPDIPANENIRHYFHPTIEGVSCNQLGHVTLPDDLEFLYQKGEVRILHHTTRFDHGVKAKIVFECFHSVSLPPGWSKIRFLNQNRQDFRKENLLFSEETTPLAYYQYRMNQCQYQYNSVMTLLEKEVVWINRGFDPDQIHSLLELPLWLRSERALASKEDPKKTLHKRKLSAYRFIIKNLSPEDLELSGIIKPKPDYK